MSHYLLAWYGSCIKNSTNGTFLLSSLKKFKNLFQLFLVYKLFIVVAYGVLSLYSSTILFQFFISHSFFYHFNLFFNNNLISNIGLTCSLRFVLLLVKHLFLSLQTIQLSGQFDYLDYEWMPSNLSSQTHVEGNIYQNFLYTLSLIHKYLTFFPIEATEILEEGFVFVVLDLPKRNWVILSRRVIGIVVQIVLLARSIAHAIYNFLYFFISVSSTKLRDLRNLLINSNPINFVRQSLNLICQNCHSIDT